MKRLTLSPAAKKAVLLGAMCSISYLAVYVVRNILGTVTPQMIESGAFTTEQIGLVSSAYFVTYAIGQLINGMIGDKIKAKYMIGLGLIFAGVCNFAFTLLRASFMLAIVAYSAMGFFLSMIYGPMTRLIAENVDLVYATRCSVGYNFASFFGSPVAGVLATFLAWQSVFNVGSAVLVFMGAVCLITFTAFENKGMIKETKREKVESKDGGIALLIKRQIIKFTLISILTGVVRTTVVFWMPTYFSERLGLSSEAAAGVFTVATLIISLNAFISVSIYEALKRNMELTLLISFSAAAVFFLLLFFVKGQVLGVGFLVAAIMASNCASSMMWSRYCPSLADTGMVSSATGFLDFISYIAAAVSSSLFANATGTIGWSGLILIWAGLMVIGVIVSLPIRKKADARMG